VSSVTAERVRFEREMLRLSGFRFARVLVVRCDTDNNYFK